MMRRRENLQRVAPHVDGFPLSLFEIGLPETRLDTSYFENINNHHKFHYRRTFGRLAILQTLRDLDTSQTQAPRDIHNLYHRLYLPSPEPALYDALEHIEDAYYNEVPLRYGSANAFRTVQITPQLMRTLYDEYDMVNEDRQKIIIA